MSYINFTPTASNAFQNALGQGVQLGQMAAEGANRRGFNNALANYDPSNPDSIKEVTRYNPQVGMQLGQQAAQERQAEQQKQQQQMVVFRQLLKKAGESPEGWAQATGAAQQLGIDMAQLPQQYDPQWAQQQLFILDALETPKGQEILSTAGKIAFDEGLRPGDGVFEQRVKELAEADLIKITSTQPGGMAISTNTRTGQSNIIAGPGGMQGDAPQPIATQVDGTTYYINPATGKVYDNAQEAMGDAGSNASGGF